MSQDFNEAALALLKRIARNTERMAVALEQQNGKPISAKLDKDDRVARAVVAIAKGASSFQEIADELGVSRCTISREPVVRRAMETAIRDRRVSKESADDFRFENLAN